MPVTFHSADISFLPKQRRKLKAFIAEQLRSNGYKKFSVRIIFCSDEFLLDINRKYLNHDYYTDIITFPLSKGETLEAELYISSERVEDNVERFNIEEKKGALRKAQIFDNETNRVIFHGLLHLIGFKDKTKEEKKQMRLQENNWLNKFQSFSI